MLQFKSNKCAQQQGDQGVGLNIQAFMRDLLMSHAQMEIKQAQALADLFAEKVAESDWVELSTGLTFEKSFDPATSKWRQEQDRPRSPFPPELMNRGIDSDVSDAAPGL